MIVSFFLRNTIFHTPKNYLWLTCYVFARLCQVLVKVVVILGMIKRVPATTPGNNVFCYSAVAHIVSPLVHLAFRPKSGFKNKGRTRAGFRLVISGSGRVQASKWGAFTTLCVFVGKGQQAEIERTVHPPPANSKNRLKSFCEVGYAHFRPNVFAPGKRISMEILVGVGVHAWCPAALKRFGAFSKKRKCARKIFIVFVTLGDLNKTSNRAVTHTSFKIHERWSVLL